MRLPLTGTCQCGSIRYEIRGEPLSVYACHCTECQRQSAGAFALSMPVARDAVVVLSGKPKSWRRTTESGRVIQCIFCPQCGVRLFHNPESNPDISVVKPGTLDETGWLFPVGHIWTRSAQPWFKIPLDAICYEGQPPDLTKLTAAWRARSSRPTAGKN
ncbi:MAG: GFA family protein [Proteobacteria bacterium]|nr:GFA family protein [Pseudomonadota bacterium]